MAGTLVAVLLVAADVARTGATPLNLIQPGTEGVAVEAVSRDFPGSVLPAGFGHDGQMFYAVARQPMHPVAAADHMGPNPRYRMQRVLFPVLAWALHPSGGGAGLVYAMVAVGVLALFGGAVATGVVGTSLGARPWTALFFPLAPGAIASLRIGTADALALAFVLAALAFSLRGRHRLAVVAAVCAALTREVALVMLAGMAVRRRDRRGLALVALPAAVATAWAVVLWRLFPDAGYRSDRAPLLRGLRDAVAHWADGVDGWSALMVVGSLVAAAAALRVAARAGLRSPLALPLAAHAGLLLAIGSAPLVLPYNSSRTTMPLVVLAALLLATRGAGVDSDASPPGDRVIARTRA